MPIQSRGVNAGQRMSEATKCEMAMPDAMPMPPPVTLSMTASMRNCRRISASRAPTARRMPISRVRSVTLTSMMFMMPMPPTTSDTAAMPANKSPITRTVALVGDLCTWLHESLAGIKPDPEQPGFKHILMHPEPVGDLTYVNATHHSPYGLIASGWQKDSSGFHWSITIPANADATIYIPSADAKNVKESGKLARHARGIKFIGAGNGRAVFNIGSGTYHFDSNVM